MIDNTLYKHEPQKRNEYLDIRKNHDTLAKQVNSHAQTIVTLNNTIATLTKRIAVLEKK